jgi:hypothetical protein
MVRPLSNTNKRERSGKATPQLHDRAPPPTQTWLEYKILAITPANERLLSPLALHPHAHTDRTYNDYVNATYESFDPQAGLPCPAGGRKSHVALVL